MLSDIFSSFDDQNQVFFSTYLTMWIISFFIIIMLNMNFWVFTHNWSLLTGFINNIIFLQTSRTSGSALGGFYLILTALFSFIIFSNLTGLIPYVFSPTSHLLFSLSIAFPLWVSLIISSVFSSPKKVIGGLLPMGAPAVLNPFLVLIETVSILVRPLTLSVRLMANMSAGHIVLGLLSIYLEAAIFMSGMSILVLSAIQIMYTIFEVGISLIQAYIFCLLLTLYSDDHPHFDIFN
uniref:ATP synthase subunit a n=1 Tax=Cyclophorus martensianus TaxID=494924 RepID=A0A4P8VVP4_9CAEN|nr:ATP synthase F0 subunit 6 [Cyclophorus martensianus]